MNKLLLLLLLPFCTLGQSSTEIQQWQQRAKRVTIYRDEYGVPHVYGKTDADAVFGFAYAQAEDAFAHIEDNYIRALGRASEIYGEEEFKTDVEDHAFEISKIARQEFDHCSPQMKNIYESYADGVNYYLYKHPGKTILLKKIEPWYPIAFLLYKYYIAEFINKTGFKNKNFEFNYSKKLTGSNAWAIGPSKTVSKNAMLFLNPHSDYYGINAFYEGHVHSDEGWNFSGSTRIGLPFLYAGHNEHLGWALTDNNFKKGDLYVEVFDNSKDTLAYKYGNEYRHAVAWNDTITINNSGKRELRIVRLKKTHHGPVFTAVDGKQIAVRMVNFETSGWIDEYYEMTKAKSLTEFKTALGNIRMPYNNIVYADDAGNILYVYNGAFPIREKQIDWSKLVDGSDPHTEWNGYHKFSELPQLLNPKDGFVLSSNSVPFNATGIDNLKREDFPFYLDYWERDGWRALRSHELLSDSEKFSFEKFKKIATDTKVRAAKDFIADLNRDFESLKTKDAKRYASLQPMMQELNNWDYISTAESIQMSLLNGCIYQFDLNENIQLVTSLENSVANLTKQWGTWKVPYGKINRLQRIDWLKKEINDDNKPSLPTTAGYGEMGIIFCMYTNYLDTVHPTKSNYGVMGNTYVSTVEFGKKIHACSILTFGESEDPSSPHYNDQTALYAAGKFKEAWFDKEDVLKHAKKVYHPGE